MNNQSLKPSETEVVASMMLCAKQEARIGKSYLPCGIELIGFDLRTRKI
jgi:hypothetical protein